MKKKQAIVIGAGIGGLATAIQLAKHGMNVTIFEKNSKPGGRCQQITKDGHIFDNGPTMFLFPQMYSDFFSSLDEDINKHIRLITSDPIYQLNFPDSSNLILTSNMEKMSEQLENIEPGSYSQFMKYLNISKKHYEFAMNELTYKNLNHPFDYFNFKNLYLLLKYNALGNHYSYASKFFKNPNLKAAFTFQDSYLSLNPFKSPAIFSMFTYTELVEGNKLPKGGMYQIIKALVKIAKKYHVGIKYDSSVKKINIIENRATGVVTEDGTEYKADDVIINADLSYAYNHLLQDTEYAKKLQQKKYSCSAIVFHWGLDKVYPQLKTHNLFFSDDYHEGFRQVIEQSQPPQNPHFYIQAPARTDLTRAPKNQDTVSVMIPINHIDHNNQVDWKRYSKDLRNYVIKRLDKYGLKDIKKHIKFEICCTPEDWQNRLNLSFGAVYGLHHNLTQLGYLRENRQHRKYKNVYFVGASNHPGSGLPTVLLSSKFTSQKILG